MIAVTGRKPRPTSSESKPSTFCRYRAPRKNIPYIPATISACTMLAPVRFRERKIRSGTSGLAARCSRRMKPTRSATAAAPKPSVWAEPQP